MLELLITETKHPLIILDVKNVEVQYPSKKEKLFIKCAQKRKCIISVCDVSTIIMQSWNINEWKLLELLILQNRHHLSNLDGNV